MMTLYLIFDYLNDNKITKNDNVKFSNYAASQKPSRLNIPIGESITVENLINGLIIKSGNDAAVAIAEKISGTEKKFVKLMNSYARTPHLVILILQILMDYLDKSNLSSAYDHVFIRVGNI